MIDRRNGPYPRCALAIVIGLNQTAFKFAITASYPGADKVEQDVYA